MNGNDIVADTSLLNNFFSGVSLAKRSMDGQRIWISGITEIELLSFSGLSKRESKLIRSFLRHCMLIGLEEPIRETAIEVRKKYKLKVPDSIIAATSVYLDFPLVTMDSDFEKVQELNTVVLTI